MSLRHSRPRTLAATGLLVALGLFLTGCGGDDSAASAESTAPSESSASSEDGASSEPDGSSPPGASADPGAESDAGTDAGANAGADGSPEEGGQEGVGPEEGGPEEGGSRNGSQEGSVRTYTGVLSYLAPGELMVGDRSFLVAEDTVTMGGDICGDPENPGAEECTAEELEMAAKAGNLTIEVAIDENGIAQRIQQT